MEFILEQQAEAAAWRVKAEYETAEIKKTLRRAIRLAVQEARNERVRRQALDARVEAQRGRFEEQMTRFEEQMTKLAAAQLVTEEKLQSLGAKIDRFVDGLRSGNGHG